jgi:hypothetical protein
MNKAIKAPRHWYRMATGTRDPNAAILSSLNAVTIEEKIKAGNPTFWQSMGELAILIWRVR